MGSVPNQMESFEKSLESSHLEGVDILKLALMEAGHMDLIVGTNFFFEHLCQGELSDEEFQIYEFPLKKPKLICNFIPG